MKNKNTTQLASSSSPSFSFLFSHQLIAQYFLFRVACLSQKQFSLLLLSLCLLLPVVRFKLFAQRIECVCFCLSMFRVRSTCVNSDYYHYYHSYFCYKRKLICNQWEYQNVRMKSICTCQKERTKTDRIYHLNPSVDERFASIFHFEQTFSWLYRKKFLKDV